MPEAGTSHRDFFHAGDARDGNGSVGNELLGTAPAICGYARNPGASPFVAPYLTG
jgi:hypothetical protein